MKKQPRKSTHEVRQMIDRWRRRLLLNEWNFNLVYPAQDVDCDGAGVLADISADGVYLTARIRIYPAWFRKDKQTREHVLVHELCHCFTEEAWHLLRSQNNGVAVHNHIITDAIERLTQRIANAVFWQTRI